MKAVVRVCNVCSNIRDEMYLRTEEYMNLHKISTHPRFRNIMGMKYCQYLPDMNDSALTIMVNTMSNAMDQIKEANDKIREFAEELEDAKLLMSFEGTSASTAVTAVTGMDGIYRFETPESLVAFFGLAVPHKESAHKKTGVGTFTKKTKPRRGLQLGLRPQNSGSIHRIKVDIVVRHGPQVWANGIPPVRLQMGPVGLEMATVSAKLLPIIAPYRSKRLLLMQETLNFTFHSMFGIPDGLHPIPIQFCANDSLHVSEGT